MTELKRYLQDACGRWVELYVVQPVDVIKSTIIGCAVSVLALLDTAELKNRVEELEEPRLKKE